MKIVQASLFAILLGSWLSSCGTDSQAAATPFGTSMKGYEIYSWQEGNHWEFSLLAGTNREKTLEEIQSEDNVLSNLDELKSVLEQIPAGQYIVWSSKETLSFPPDDILKQVEQICKDQGLILSVAR